MAVTPETWFKTMPVVTKTYFCLAFGSTLLCTFGVISPMHLYLDFELVWKKFEIWRLFTCFIFFGKFSLPFLFSMLILTRYSTMLENGYFLGNKGTAEMVFMMMFAGFVQWIVAYFWAGLYFLSSAMMFTIIYVWSRKDPYMAVSFWGFAFKAWHFPFVLTVFSMLLGASPVLNIVGIAVGHLYHYLRDIVPTYYPGWDLLQCPQFMYNLFEEQNVHGRNQRWQGGAGYRLGGGN
eukprot:TRINITY_DN58066_c0_g1_i1.p1 TRINITY_DN58066_c0_g1~~TRINITY_DN58066_c0_g1_i1.p1  ORF type:complete len:235 (+),score=92.24 TRINITY_DN58066_c0_g1_i1:48-752(+)